MKLKALLGGTLCALAFAGASHAAVSFTLDTASPYAKPAGQTSVDTFDSPIAAGDTLTGFVTTTGSSTGVYSQPYTGTSASPIPDTTAYGYLTATAGNPPGSGTLTLAAPTTSLSFLWGSIDPYNTVTFLNGSTTVGSFTGSQVDATAGDSQGGTVNFTSSTPFTSVSFTTSQNSFELDNLAVGSVSAAPEPSVWALMLGGVAFLGMALRMRSRKVGILRIA